MGEPSLQELERDVEAARAKLGRNLSTLSSPNTYSQFSDTLKDEAVSLKDAVIDKAKTSVQSAVEAFVDDLKAKAAANPTAALAIGAGIAWRLIQRPPVATVLVGAGLFSLLKTDATHSKGRTNADYVAEATGRLQEQASDFAADVTERAGRVYDAAADRASELASTVTDRVGEATSSAAAQITGVASAATERLQEWSDDASATLKDAAGPSYGEGWIVGPPRNWSSRSARSDGFARSQSSSCSDQECSGSGGFGSAGLTSAGCRWRGGDRRIGHCISKAAQRANKISLISRKATRASCFLKHRRLQAPAHHSGYWDLRES